MGQPDYNWQREIVDSSGNAVGTQANPVLTGSSYTEVAPIVQASTDTAAVVSGSIIDMRAFRSLSYTVTVAGNTITWWVYGSNRSDFADEAIVSGPTDVLAGAGGSYALASASYSFYRVKIKSKVNGAAGSVTLCALSKC